MIKALVLGTATLALSAGVASAQAVYPGYGYAATAPLYDYAAPAYGYGAVAPGTAGTTVIIVTPGAPAYSAPPVGAGYYNYAPGYGGGYYGRAGYWGWR